jgi:hypothetical protein
MSAVTITQCIVKYCLAQTEASRQFMEVCQCDSSFPTSPVVTDHTQTHTHTLSLTTTCSIYIYICVCVCVCVCVCDCITVLCACIGVCMCLECTALTDQSELSSAKELQSLSWKDGSHNLLDDPRWFNWRTFKYDWSTVDCESRWRKRKEERRDEKSAREREGDRGKRTR